MLPHVLYAITTLEDILLVVAVYVCQTILTFPLMEYALSAIIHALLALEIHKLLAHHVDSLD